MKPLISFGQDKYVWKKGDKLDVLIDVRSRVVSIKLFKSEQRFIAVNF